VTGPRDLAPPGFRCHVANIGVKDDTDDFVVIAADRPVPAAGVFTRSRFAGPSVTSAASTSPTTGPAIVVVSKNANVANGPDGHRRRPRARAGVAARLGCDPTTCSWPRPA
jgi:glutamate N-acetyltransferase / amino-acid N-acetyltransferase